MDFAYNYLLNGIGRRKCVDVSIGYYVNSLRKRWKFQKVEGPVPGDSLFNLNVCLEGFPVRALWADSIERPPRGQVPQGQFHLNSNGGRFYASEQDIKG